MHTKSPIKVGQIGIGHGHANGTMRTFRKLSDRFEVVGVVEPDPAWREKRGHDPAYAGLPWLAEEELLGIDGLEAVAIETDVPNLSPTALRCLQAGKHIQMDKPTGETYGEFEEVVEEARKRDLCVHMGYMFRHNPAIQFCLQAVRNGWLGEIFEIDAVMSRKVNPVFRQRISRFAGGALYIFGCHLIDLVISMLGRPDGIRPYLKQTCPECDTLYDNGMAVLEYKKATAVVRTTVVEVEGFLRRQLVVCGTKGTIEIYPIEPFNQPHPMLPKLRMALAEPMGEYTAGYQDVVFDQMPGRYDAQIAEFADIVQGIKDNPHSYDHELLLHECTLRACGYALEGAEEKVQ